MKKALLLVIILISIEKIPAQQTNYEWIVTPQYDDAFTYFQEGLLGVAKNGFWGFIDKEGTLKVDCKYYDLQPFSDGLAEVIIEKPEEGYSVPSGHYIDKNGKEHYFPFAKGPYSNGLFYYVTSESLIDPCYDFFDKDGNCMTNFGSKDFASFSEGLVWVSFERDEMTYGGFKDKSWNWGVKPRLVGKCAKPDFDNENAEYINIIPRNYDWEDFYKGYAAIKIDGKWIIIDKTGKEITPLRFEEVTRFDNGLIKVKYNKLYGYINTNGEWAIKPKFKNSGSYSDGLIGGITVTEQGYFDSNGKLVISIKTKECPCFFWNGYAQYQSQTGKWGIIDKRGNIVVTPQFERIFSACLKNESIYMVSDGRQWGLIKIKQQ